MSDQSPLEQPEVVLDRLGIGVFTFDSNWCFTNMNKPAEERFDRPADELLGESVWEVYEEAEDSEFYEKYHKAMDRQKQLSVDIYYEPWDRWYEEHLYPSSDGLLVISNEITERKGRERKLTYQASLFEAILETSIDAMHVVDEDRQVVAYNQQFIEMWDIPEDVIEERSSQQALESVLHMVEQPDEFVETIRYLYEHPNEERRDRIRLTDGRVLDRYSAPVTDPEGTFYGRIWIYRDITELIERTQEIKRQNERLEEFAGIVSHDLRNPLTVAQGRLDLVRDECDSDHLDHIARAHDRMEALIEDLLTLAREGQEIEELESVNLADLSQRCWRTVATGDATLVTETDRTIQADRGRLRQLLENLMRNAIEHGGEAVTVTIDDLDGGFYVADDGPGIPPEKRTQVLDAGYSTTAEGTGFGLSIVAQIAAAHEWELSVTESTEGGTRFDITGVTFSQ